MNFFGGKEGYKRMVKNISEFEEKMKLLEQVLPLLRKIDKEQQKSTNH